MSIEKTMAVIGTKSAMLILREAYYGTTRFDDFARRVGITKAAAVGAALPNWWRPGLRLGQAVRTASRASGARDEDVLTDAGTDLMPVRVGRCSSGGRRHLTDDSRLRLAHLGCGADATVEIRRAEGHPGAAGRTRCGAGSERRPRLRLGDAAPA